MKRATDNNVPLYVALGTAAMLLVGAVVTMKVLLRAPPPKAPAPPAPAPTGREPIAEAPLMYQETLAADAQRFGLEGISLEALAEPLQHALDLVDATALRPGRSLDTPHLSIALRTERREAQSERGGFRANHLVLAIENKTDLPLAYRVETTLDHPERCLGRAVMVHNAVALAPRGRVERTECLERPGASLRVVRVETVTLPPIGYYYVSQLVPAQIGIDVRTSAGHAPPRSLTTCNLPYWRDFVTWGLGWADLIDFFARHDCNRYGPFPAYRFRSERGPLPARP